MVDTLASGASGRKPVKVQVLFSVPLSDSTRFKNPQAAKVWRVFYCPTKCKRAIEGAQPYLPGAVAIPEKGAATAHFNLIVNVANAQTLPVPS